MRKKRGQRLDPYSMSPHIEVEYELQISPRVTLTPGDKFKTKQAQGTFVFIQVAKNLKEGVEWVDCKDKNQVTRSFYTDTITKRVKR